jgi:hypothetical protein
MQHPAGMKGVGCRPGREDKGGRKASAALPEAAKLRAWRDQTWLSIGG